MVSSGSFKQGYLHIKRERGSSAVASRIRKPWQQAYFILRKDPYILEEYKDASLKTQKQVHFIGTVKHVGSIRTSKSKQYAFEVVMREKTPLLLACDNEILLDEWINAFTEIMHAVNDMQRKNSETFDKLSSLDRHIKSPEKHHIEVIETTLSEANDLHGEYDLLLSTSRILLTDPDDGEVLSWPLSHMTSFRGHANSQRIIFSMGRNCHFGCGKLIFETKAKERILNFIQSIYPRKNSGSHEPLSNSFSSSSTSSRHLVDGSFSSMEKNETFFDDRPVFDSPILEQKEVKLNQDSITIEENNNQQSVIGQVGKENDTEAFRGNTINFAEITSEDAYILPNEKEIDERWRITHSHFSRFSSGRAHVFARSRQNSDNEVDSSSYLQILEEEVTVDSNNFVNGHRIYKTPSLRGNKEEDEMQKLLESVTSSLENPLHNENVLAHLCEQKKSKSTSAVVVEKKNMDEHRRASEPFTKPVDSSKTKLVHTRGVHSQDASCITEHIKSSFSSISEFPGIPPVSSPVGHKKLFKPTQDAFPKQRSITNKTFGSESAKSPFSKAESFLTRPLPQSISYHAIQKKSGILSMRRNQTQPVLPTCKSPDLNRNTKPRLGNINSSEFMKTQDAANTTFNSADGDPSEEPPPLPERISPTNLLHNKLHRTDLRKNVDDTVIMHDKKSNHETMKFADEVCSSTNEKSISNGSINTDSPALRTSGGFGTLLAPPLPPKSKVLSSTRSAPLSGSFDVPSMSSVIQNRRSSYESATDSQLTDTTEDGQEDQPPEIPNRDHIPLMVKQSHSSSDGNLLSISDTPPPTPPRTPPRKYSPSFGIKKIDSKVLSRSLDSNQMHNLLSVTVTNYEVEDILTTRKPRSSTLTDNESNAPLTEPARGFNTIPKSLIFSPSSSNFPKSPKKFF